MKILSIDLGIRNLALCVLSIKRRTTVSSTMQTPVAVSLSSVVQQDKLQQIQTLLPSGTPESIIQLQKEYIVCIHNWKVVDILQNTDHENTKDLSISNLNCLMQRCLYEQNMHAGVDIVAIENQPVGFHKRSNTRMKVLSHCIESFMYNQCPDHVEICFVSPKKKFMWSPLADTQEAAANKKASARYRLHKKMACNACQMILQLCDPKWTNLFSAHKKKDDLADCFLQGLVIVHRPPPKKPPLTIDQLQVGNRVGCLRGKRVGQWGSISSLGPKKCRVRLDVDGKLYSYAPSSLKKEKNDGKTAPNMIIVKEDIKEHISAKVDTLKLKHDTDILKHTITLT